MNIWVGALLAVAAGAGYMAQAQPSNSIELRLAPDSRCNIKGNVSHNNGERISHVTGQKYYEQTVITPSRGERWFCSEAEAQKAGWRKSGV